MSSMTVTKDGQPNTTQKIERTPGGGKDMFEWHHKIIMRGKEYLFGMRRGVVGMTSTIVSRQLGGELLLPLRLPLPLYLWHLNRAN
jgi:hypothetical protein